VDASTGSAAAWSLPAVPSTVSQMRRRAAAFASAAGASKEVSHAVALAVSETVTNSVVHAYVGTEPGLVRVHCRTDGERLTVHVIDEGSGVTARDDSPGLGHGLATVGALAQALEITSQPDGSGTVVTMAFASSNHRPAAPGLEPLCDLALERVADVSCVDAVHGGVLRRVAAQVAGDDAQVQSMLTAKGPHDYEPRPSDARKLRRADLFLVNGLGLDDDIGKRLAGAAGNPHLKTVEVGESVPEGELLDAGEHGHAEHGHVRRGPIDERERE
jgi:anti-sigma regulatory factor (Ser/Thr protein kinase)